MGLQPLHDYYVIEVEEKQEVSKSGIILSPSVKPTSVAVVKTLPASGSDDIAVGDRVAISKYAPLEMSIDGEPVTVIDYSDIYGVVTE